MKKSYIISFCSIAIILIGGCGAFFLTQHERRHNSLLSFDIQIIPQQSSYVLNIVSTGNQDDNNIFVWKSDIESSNTEGNKLWNAHTTLSYNT